MQQSSTMNKQGPVWTILLFLWNIRKIVSIILMAITLVYLFFSETLEQRRFMLVEFGEEHSLVTMNEAALKILGDEVFRGPSQDGRPITSEQASGLYSGIQRLHSNLATLSPPNQAVEDARDRYARSLTKVLGALNLFEEEADGTSSVLKALQAIEIPAAKYRNAVKRYQNSVWRSFWAAF